MGVGKGTNSEEWLKTTLKGRLLNDCLTLYVEIMACFVWIQGSAVTISVTSPWWSLTPLVDPFCITGYRWVESVQQWLNQRILSFLLNGEHRSTTIHVVFTVVPECLTLFVGLWMYFTFIFQKRAISSNGWFLSCCFSTLVFPSYYCALHI